MTTPFQRALLARLVGAMGLGASVVPTAGCGGETASPGSPDASLADATPEDDAIAADTSVPPSDNVVKPPPPPPRPDAPNPDADTPEDKACAKLVVSRADSPDAGICSQDAAAPGLFRRSYACLPAPPAGQSCEATYSAACVLNTYVCGLSSRAQSLVCGPFVSDDGACCYLTEGSCPVGRPFVVDGAARVAKIGNDPSWAGEQRPVIDALDAETRVALADVWTQDALTEHASIASFSRFVLQCLAVGAPADIVRDAQRACLDEFEHARIAFGLASVYAGRPVGPGGLDVTRSLDQMLDPIDIACSVAAEGCIAELVSAALIAGASHHAGDAVIKTALTTIAEQEIEHALLAWRYLAWAIANGGSALRERVATLFEHMHEHVGFGARTTLPANVEAMRAHGYLPIEERRRIAVGILDNVVAPAARELLSLATRTVSCASRRSDVACPAAS